MSELFASAAVSAASNVIVACSAFWWARSSSRPARAIFPILCGVLLLGSFSAGAWSQPPQALKGLACLIAALILAVPGIGLALRASHSRGNVASALVFPACAAGVLGAAFPITALALVGAFTGDAL